MYLNLSFIALERSPIMPIPLSGSTTLCVINYAIKIEQRFVWLHKR